MKSVLTSLAAAALMFVACTPTTTPGTAPSAIQKNLNAFRTVTQAFESGDVSHLDDVIAADFVDHTDQGDKNRDSLKAYIQMIHKSGITLKQEEQKAVADSDYVFAMMHYTGVGDGVMMPKGPFDMHAVEVVRFKDGKGVEHWSFSDMAEMMKMMGEMKGASAQAPTAGKDSTKK
ncbi:MAG: ester cyclase [Bacteroidetes bacterium]|nr:ester cyclase [Bacteroidota bacterium]MBS1628700.1 ester cyclase [Bacteroidota bacterium]